jgi:hypothetical protein
LFRDRLQQRLFRAVRLVMSSGESDDVRHPEMAWLTQTDVFIGVDRADDGIRADA